MKMEKCKKHEGKKEKNCPECHVFKSKLGWTWVGTMNYYETKELAKKYYEPYSPRKNKIMGLQKPFI